MNDSELAATVTAFDPTSCLALVEQSPAAVAAHDKQAWLGLFALYNIVEDPVGSTPHLSGVYDARSGRRGHAALERFYETFIAPNEIRFHVERDIVCGLEVVRDLDIEITMAPGVTVRTPMHLLYQLREEGSGLKIFRLAAHWELRPMLGRQMRAARGRPGVSLSVGWNMFRNLGPGGVMGFMRALNSVGDRGKERVHRFQQCYKARDSRGMGALFDSGDVRIALPGEGRELSPGECLDMGGELGFDKLISAGNFVTATVSNSVDGECRRGVAFFEFDRRSLRIVNLSLYF